jgi:hypothetical protein
MPVVVQSRCVLQDAVHNQHTIIVRPGNWMSLSSSSNEGFSETTGSGSITRYSYGNSNHDDDDYVLPPGVESI